MRCNGVAPSHLPNFLLPCPHCGHRMAVTSVAPARDDDGAESNDLEDVIHGCVQCGTTLISTRRSLSDHSPAIAQRV
jgi:DNA-directed RNA polymerase subunit RPC12/RpoP